MADRATNEYLNSQRAQNDHNDLFAAIGKQVLGLQLGDDEDKLPEDERVKVVEEIESLCMNCEENVGRPGIAICQEGPLSWIDPVGAKSADAYIARGPQDYFLPKYPFSAK